MLNWQVGEHGAADPACLVFLVVVSVLADDDDSLTKTSLRSFKVSLQRDFLFSLEGSGQD